MLVSSDEEETGMTDQKPTQAMGTGTPGDAHKNDGTNDPGNTSAYPNPHTGKTERGEGGKLSGVMGHGGQSDIGYHGSGRLGDEDAGDGSNANSPTKDSEPG